LRVLFLINLCILPIDVFFYHRLEFKPAFDVIDWTADFFFMADFLLHFRRTHRVPETNELITSKSAIARHYLHTWAAVDFFGAVPWDLLYYRGTAVVNHFRFVKLLKLLRVSMMLRAFADKQGTGKNAYAKRVGKTLFIFIMTAHWVGAVWWFIGAFETESAQRTLVELGLDPSVYDENWLQRPQQRSTPLSKDSSFGQQYWSSIYWAFTSLVKVSTRVCAPRASTLRAAPRMHAHKVGKCTQPQPTDPLVRLCFPPPLTHFACLRCTHSGPVDRAEHNPREALRLVHRLPGRHPLRLAARLDSGGHQRGGPLVGAAARPDDADAPVLGDAPPARRCQGLHDPLRRRHVLLQ